MPPSPPGPRRPGCPPPSPPSPPCPRPRRPPPGGPPSGGPPPWPPGPRRPGPPPGGPPKPPPGPPRPPPCPISASMALASAANSSRVTTPSLFASARSNRRSSRSSVISSRVNWPSPFLSKASMRVTMVDVPLSVTGPLPGGAWPNACSGNAPAHMKTKTNVQRWPVTVLPSVQLFPENGKCVPSTCPPQMGDDYLLPLTWEVRSPDFSQVYLLKIRGPATKSQ